MPTLKAGDPIESDIAIRQALRAEQGSAARLATVFSDDSSFEDLRHGWIQQRGGSGIMVSGTKFLCLLIKSVIDGHSAKSFVEEARAFADCRTSKTESYTPLAGATVAEAVSLGNGIDLVPWADVPDGNQKRFFGLDSSHHVLASSMPFFPQMVAIANSAIRVRSAECQVLFSSSEAAKAEYEASASENTARSVQTRDVVRCITALSMGPVAALGKWERFDKKIANDVSGAGYSYDGSRLDSAIWAASSKPVALDGDPIARLFHRFEEFKPSKNKNVMRISLDRLSQALRRQNIVDKAIDLGIALEVMLLHGMGASDRGELSFRSSIRGATFLGGEKPERLKTFKLLRDAYDLRSKAVHSGLLKKEKKRPPPEQILEDAISTCARIARQLIDRGSFPNWEAEYVIGGQLRDPVP